MSLLNGPIRHVMHSNVSKIPLVVVLARQLSRLGRILYTTSLIVALLSWRLYQGMPPEERCRLAAAREARRLDMEAAGLGRKGASTEDFHGQDTGNARHRWPDQISQAKMYKTPGEAILRT